MKLLALLSTRKKGNKVDLLYDHNIRHRNDDFQLPNQAELEGGVKIDQDPLVKKPMEAKTVDSWPDATKCVSLL